MSPLTRILIGLIALGIGMIMVYKSDDVVLWIGPNSWAEKVFVSGGSSFFYKLVGVFVCFVGIVMITDLFDIVFGNMLIRLFRLN